MLLLSSAMTIECFASGRLLCVFVYEKLRNQNCPHQNSSTATQSMSALIHAYSFLSSQKHTGTYFLAPFAMAPCIQKHYFFICLLFIILLTLFLFVGKPVCCCLYSASPKQIIFENNKVELNWIRWAPVGPGICLCICLSSLHITWYLFEFALKAISLYYKTSLWCPDAVSLKPVPRTRMVICSQWPAFYSSSWPLLQDTSCFLSPVCGHSVSVNEGRTSTTKEGDWPVGISALIAADGSTFLSCRHAD